MSGIDLILTSLCLNITCDYIRLEKSPAQAEWLMENCIKANNGTCMGYNLPKATQLAFNTVESNATSSRELKGPLNDLCLSKMA